MPKRARWQTTPIPGVPVPLLLPYPSWALAIRTLLTPDCPQHVKSCSVCIPANEIFSPLPRVNFLHSLLMETPSAVKMRSRFLPLNHSHIPQSLLFQFKRAQWWLTLCGAGVGSRAGGGWNRECGAETCETMEPGGVGSEEGGIHSPKRCITHHSPSHLPWIWKGLIETEQWIYTGMSVLCVS